MNQFDLLNQLNQMAPSNYEQTLMQRAQDPSAAWMSGYQPKQFDQNSVNNVNKAAMAQDDYAIRSMLTAKLGGNWFNEYKQMLKDQQDPFASPVIGEDAQKYRQDAQSFAPIIGAVVGNQNVQQQRMMPQQPMLQPFQMTSQYQGYMQGNAQAPSINSFNQMLPYFNQPVNFNAQQNQNNTQQNPFTQVSQAISNMYQPNAGFNQPVQQATNQQRGLLTGGQFGAGNRYGLLSALG